MTNENLNLNYDEPNREPREDYDPGRFNYSPQIRAMHDQLMGKVSDAMDWEGLMDAYPACYYTGSELDYFASIGYLLPDGTLDSNLPHRAPPHFQSCPVPNPYNPAPNPYDAVPNPYNLMPNPYDHNNIVHAPSPYSDVSVGSPPIYDTPPESSPSYVSSSSSDDDGRPASRSSQSPIKAEYIKCEQHSPEK